MSTIRGVDDIGRVVIPKDVRKILGIRQYDQLEVRINTETGQILMEKVESES